MTRRTTLRAALALVLAGFVAAATTLVVWGGASARMHVTAYFDNTNGMFTGDEVRILGVRVGQVERIEPQAQRVKVTFWVDDKYKVPKDAAAVIISPTLITARAIQLTPAYTGGPVMDDGAVIPESRTAVPVEWDDLRTQLQKLTDALQPTEPGGHSTLGEFINTAADNLRGQGPNIRQTIINMSQAMSILGDHSDDIFTTIKNVSVLVSALTDSKDVLANLNGNLAAVTSLIADDPDEIGRAVTDVNAAVNDVRSFVAENKEPIGIATEKLSSISQAVTASLDDLKQTLHVAPNAFQNFINIYQPAQAAFTGNFAITNFANPIQFLCGAIEAASRLGAEQSAKLCVQYLAPIVKNRQFNFLPFGAMPFVGTQARPNEVTYSEDWMRPDFVPPGPAQPADAVEPAPLAAESTSPPGSPPTPEPVSTDPAAGLPGLMTPPAPGAGQ